MATCLAVVAYFVIPVCFKREPVAVDARSTFPRAGGGKHSGITAELLLWGDVKPQGLKTLIQIKQLGLDFNYLHGGWQREKKARGLL
jgi:hypothetical protein